MSTDRVPVTVSYRKRGLAPPVFVAGSFADPHWELQEMHGVIDESGEHHFTIQVPVEPGKEYYYKFKAANQDDWVLDEHATVVKDDLGKPCNLLKVPMTSDAARRAHTPLVEATERLDDGSPAAPGQETIVASGPKSLLPNAFQDKARPAGHRSGTPIKEVAEVAAEVADTAAKLDELQTTTSSPMPARVRVNKNEAVEEEMATPLFAHEAFGAYDFVHDGLDHDDFGKNPKSPSSMVSDSGCSLGDVDIDDPTLEEFPSDKSSVIDTLRKIQSSTDEGRSSFEDGQHSTPATSRRTSLDSLDGNGGQLSPTSARKQDNRASRSSFGRPRSAVSLECIDEEPKASGDVSPGTKYDSETQATGTQGDGSTTDEDSGLVMKPAKA
ncbi:uncharacterized protein MAM_05807 [Metarhizium album ARSEF 1941]|uniref:AMP-activated protein kinase glycogen-binding domain-containing protein n=1 Tax=Metarhizium album (strain ARSEF 1941) TaxID=1081103 RepID=A0A0B2WJL9_METAS|nr:uncharacterized protein MAM_05807 [Metarhizium album ARSEF 1941]KHN96221.1 hypothetical protein MAM_05807 [Metarhizium album ARSEF 1941]